MSSTFEHIMGAWKSSFLARHSAALALSGMDLLKLKAEGEQNRI